MVGIDEEDIIGIESPLWSETVTTMDEIEYMLFPRLPGYAEIGWSKGEKDWVDYQRRLSSHVIRWEYMDIDYYKSPKVAW